MELVKRKNLSEAVVEKIKRYIMDRGLKPGDRLPSEQELAEQFGVSRIVVREATKALNFLGIIRSAPRRGLTVGEVDMARLTEYLGFHFAIGGYPKEVLLKARIVLETGALPYTMQSMKENPEIYPQLMAHVQRLGELADDIDGYIQEDIKFHHALVKTSGVEPLVAFTDLLHVFFLHYKDSVASAKRLAGNKSHQQIVEALHRGKLNEAQQVLRKHLEYYLGQH